MSSSGYRRGVSMYPARYFELDFTGDIGIFMDAEVSIVETDPRGTNIALLSFEPNEIIGPGPQDYVLANPHRYDLILTDKPALLHLPNARRFIYAHPWMLNLDEESKPSVYGVSTIVGRKTGTYGHRMRHELWDRQTEITALPRFFYSSHLGGPASSLILHGDKTELFRYQFQIVIENTKSDFYMTEKLIDCIRMKVVPIYFGAKNIASFFDTAGMIIADNVGDIIDHCNGLNESSYPTMLPHVEQNYARSAPYLNLGARVSAAIRCHLVEKW